MTIPNHRRRQKKEGDEDEYMSHLGSYKWFRKTQVIPEYVVFYKEVGVTWRVSDSVKN